MLREPQLLEPGNERLSVKISYRNLKPIQERKWIPPFQRLGHWRVQVSWKHLIASNRKSLMCDQVGNTYYEMLPSSQKDKKTKLEASHNKHPFEPSAYEEFPVSSFTTHSAASIDATSQCRDLVLSV